MPSLDVGCSKRRSLVPSGSVSLRSSATSTKPNEEKRKLYESGAKLLGVKVSKATICRMIKRMGYTRRKGAWVREKEMSG
jgi:hypothetical protein